MYELCEDSFSIGQRHWKQIHDTIFFVEVKIARSGIRLDLFALRWALAVHVETMLKRIKIHLGRTGQP